MRILLKFELDCTPDAAWRAIRSPAVLKQVAFPLLAFESLESGGFPKTWPEGDHPVALKAFGRVTVGEQVIGISFPARDDDVRVVRDTGRGLSGPLTLVTQWQHQMAVSPLPDGRTLYRDQLMFSAGAATLPLWVMYWLFWQWRAAGIRRLAPTWR